MLQHFWEQHFFGATFFLTVVSGADAGRPARRGGVGVRLRPSARSRGGRTQPQLAAMTGRAGR
jgi:hypothetical protein